MNYTECNYGTPVLQHYSEHQLGGCLFMAQSISLNLQFIPQRIVFNFIFLPLMCSTVKFKRM